MRCVYTCVACAGVSTGVCGCDCGGVGVCVCVDTSGWTSTSLWCCLRSHKVFWVLLALWRLPHTALLKNQHAATRCNTLQHAATRCNTLQHATTQYTGVKRLPHSYTPLLHTPPPLQPTNTPIHTLRLFHRSNTHTHTAKLAV